MEGGMEGERERGREEGKERKVEGGKRGSMPVRDCIEPVL